MTSLKHTILAATGALLFTLATPATVDAQDVGTQVKRPAAERAESQATKKAERLEARKGDRKVKRAERKVKRAERKVKRGERKIKLGKGKLERAKTDARMKGKADRKNKIGKSKKVKREAAKMRKAERAPKATRSGRGMLRAEKSLERATERRGRAQRAPVDRMPRKQSKPTRRAI